MPGLLRPLASRPLDWLLPACARSLGRSSDYAAAAAIANPVFQWPGAGRLQDFAIARGRLNPARPGLRRRHRTDSTRLGHFPGCCKRNTAPALDGKAAVAMN